MGYKEYAINLYKKGLDYLITNHSNNNDSLTNLGKEHLDLNARYFIPDYNPELFLAIAAMTDSISPIVGEWIVYTDSMAEMCGLTAGELYRIGKLNTNTKYMRKATLQELIEKFTNKETIKESVMKIEATTKLIEELKGLIAPENEGKFNKLMGIEKPMFRKEDFITGDKVFTRDGTLWLVIKDSNTIYYGRQLFVLVSLVSNKDFLVSESYDDNLKMEDLIYSRYDIMKVYRSGNAFISGFILEKSIADYDLIWSRE